MTGEILSPPSPSDKVSESDTLTPDTRPAKPSLDFPLFAHQTGRWAKKVKGKLIYLGPWSDPDGALKTWRAIESGKTIKQAKAVAKRQPVKDKPAKPSPDFPLFAHASRRWAKKVRGKLHYFGKWEHSQAALDKWLKEKDYLLAGKRPPVNYDGMTVRRLCDYFFASKQAKHQTGEITTRTLNEYETTCTTLAAAFGDVLADDLTANDFAKLRQQLAKRLGMIRLGNEIVRSRSVFKFAVANRHITMPVCFGTEFARPSAKALRIERAKKGVKIIEADEVRQLIDMADTNMKAMILLAINAGMGNADIAEMRFHHIDLSAATITYPRPKSGIDRKAYLWPQTVKAVEQAISKRPEAKDKADADRVFITRYGNAWNGDTTDNPITKEFSKMLASMGTRRKGMSFYALRHTFRTAVDSLPDQRAIDRVMGHVSQHISAAYVEFIDDARLKAVADHIHRWLFNEPMAKATTGKRGDK